MIVWLSVVLSRTVVAVADSDLQMGGGGGGEEGRRSSRPGDKGRGAGPLDPSLGSTTVLTL